ncbi:hypothetical protein N9W95_03010, partial [Paracoccaceae bacterium]|nr:hypothetical protein [Paracoccaceae bacterium]
LTGGVVTAVAISTDIADYDGTNATLTTVSSDKIAISINNTSVDAAKLVVLDNKTATTINATAVEDFSGAADEVAAIVSSDGVSLDTDFTSTVTNEDGKSYVDAADIVTIDNAGSGTVTATSITEMQGTADNIVSAATSGHVTIDGDMLFNVTSGEADVTQINTLDALTSGIITAVISENDAATLITLDNDNGNNALTIELTDSDVLASNLATIASSTSVAVNGTAIGTIEGSLDNVKSVFNSGGVTLTVSGDTAVDADITNSTVVAADVKIVDTATAGSVNINTATSITGTAADIATVMGSSGVSHVSGTLQATTDTGSIDSADLITIDNNSGRIVLASTASEITGTETEIVAVIGRTSGIEIAGTTAATVNDGTASVSNVSTMSNGSRIVTATVDTGVVSELIAGLPDSTKNVLTIEVTDNGSDTLVDPADLITLAAKTTSAINIDAVNVLTGEAEDVVAVYDAGSSDFTNLGTEQVTITGTANASDLKLLLEDTNQNITLGSVSSVSGSVSDLDDVLASARIVGWDTAYPPLTVSGSSVDADSLKSLADAVATKFGADNKTGKVVSTATTFSGSADNVLDILTSVVVSEPTDPNVTLSDDTIAADTLIDIKAQTGGTINVATASTVQGDADDVATVLAVSYVSGLGGENVTLTDTSVAASKITTVQGLTSEIVNMATVVTLSGTADQVNAIYTNSKISGKGNEQITLSDETLDAAKLKTADGNVSGNDPSGNASKVDASDARTLQGSAEDVADAFDAQDDGTVSGLDWTAVAAATYEVDVTGTTAAALDLLNIANSVETTDVDIEAVNVTTVTGSTANITSVLQDADFEDLGESGETAEIDDQTVAASALNDLNDLTLGTVDASSVTTLTGNAVVVNETYTDAGNSEISGLGNENVTIDDTSLDASVLKTLDENTDGTVSAASITTISGTAENMAAVYGSSGISGLGDENSITVTDSGASAAAADLNTIVTKINAVDGSKTLVVDKNITTITGSAEDVKAAYTSSTASDISGLGNEAVTITGSSAAASDLNYISSNSTGTSALVNTSDNVSTITGDLSAVNTFLAYVNSGDASKKSGVALTLSDTSVTATGITDIMGLASNKTTGVVSIAESTQVTGTQTELNAFFTKVLDNKVVTQSNYNVVIATDTSVTATNLNNYDTYSGSGTVTTTATTITGAIEDIATALTSGQVSHLSNINVSFDTITSSDDVASINTIIANTTGTVSGTVTGAADVLANISADTGTIADGDM